MLTVKFFSQEKLDLFMSHPVPDQFVCVYAINSTNWTNRATLWCPKLTHSWVTKEIYRAKKEILLNYFASSLSIFVLFLFLIYMSPKLRYILYCLISNSIASAYNWPQTSPIMCELEFRLVHAILAERKRGMIGSKSRHSEFKNWHSLGAKSRERNPLWIPLFLACLVCLSSDWRRE